MTAPSIKSIEERRAALGIAKQALEREAALPNGYYVGHLLSGRCRPRASTLSALALALERLSSRSRRRRGDRKLQMIFRAFVVIAARELGHDAAEVHGQDPALRATHSEEWMRAAEVRQLAAYLMNQAAGFSQTEVAVGGGMSKQAVHTACKQITDRNAEGGELERLIDRLTRQFQGEWWG